MEEVHQTLLRFHELSGEEWLLHIDHKYSRTPVFRNWLKHFYDEYVKEMVVPTFYWDFYYKSFNNLFSNFYSVIYYY